MNYFPYVLSDKRKKHTGKNLEVQLAGSTNSEVICNLKIHFTQEFLVNVEAEVAANLKGRSSQMYRRICSARKSSPLFILHIF